MAQRPCYYKNQSRVYSNQALPTQSGTQSGQSEEHLVLTTDKAETLTIGTVLYAIPMHICPTVIKYPKALVIIGGAVDDTWKIAARDYFLPD